MERRNNEARVGHDRGGGDATVTVPPSSASCQANFPRVTKVLKVCVPGDNLCEQCVLVFADCPGRLGCPSPTSTMGGKLNLPRSSRFQLCPPSFLSGLLRSRVVKATGVLILASCATDSKPSAISLSALESSGPARERAPRVPFPTTRHQVSSFRSGYS